MLKKFTASFVLRPDRKGLYLRIICDRKKADLSLGWELTREQLDDAMSAKPKPQNLRFAAILNQYLTQVNDVRLSLIRDNKGVTAKQVRDLMRKELLGIEPETPAEDPNKGEFVKFFKETIDSKATNGTKQVYKGALEALHKAVPDLDDLTFDDITLALLHDIDAKFTQMGHCRNTRSRRLQILQAVMNRACDYELTTNDPFRRFKLRMETTLKRALTIEQLMTFMKLDLPAKYELVRDLFILDFMLIGINSVDLYNLTEIQDGRIVYRRAKTHKLYSIKVEPEAMLLIEKLRGKEKLLLMADKWSSFISFEHFFLTRLAEMHTYTQEKGLLPRDFPRLTPYWARHTWATIAAELDVSDTIISQALGHSSGCATTNIYIKRNMQKVDEANRRVLNRILGINT